MAPTIGTQQLVAWLDDAYAIESGLVGILENHASHFTREQMPAAARRIQQHIIETKQHAQRLQDPVVLEAVNDLESLTSDLARKIWQKISILTTQSAREM